MQRVQDQQLVPEEYLVINNAYEFFSRAGGLLKTGPTHTNVMDVRVAVIVP
jgi:hydroxypyruvate reductase